MRLDRNEDRAIGVFVQIRAANSDETISDQDFAGCGLFPWAVDGFEPQILGRVKTKRFHVVFPSSVLVVTRLSSGTEWKPRGCAWNIDVVRIQNKWDLMVRFRRFGGGHFTTFFATSRSEI